MSAHDTTRRTVIAESTVRNVRECEVIVVSNREPFRDENDDGSIATSRPASGLTVRDATCWIERALEPNADGPPETPRIAEGGHDSGN